MPSKRPSPQLFPSSYRVEQLQQASYDKPTSLQQIFALLGLSAERWTRWFALVAANDRGHIAEMVGLGATPEEIAQVRAADRAA